jgi:hypothetical protein
VSGHSAETWERARALWNTGASGRQVRAATGISLDALYGRTREPGWSVHPRGRPPLHPRRPAQPRRPSARQRRAQPDRPHVARRCSACAQLSARLTLHAPCPHCGHQECVE